MSDIFEELKRIDELGNDTTVTVEDFRKKMKEEQREKQTHEDEKTQDEISERIERELKYKADKLEDTISRFINTNEEGMDIPGIFECEYIKGAFELAEIKIVPKALTLRQLKAIQSRLFKGYDNVIISKIREPQSDEEYKMLECAKQKIRAIKESDDPQLDKKGVITKKIYATGDFEIDYSKYDIDVNVETTLRQVLLTSPDFDIEKMNFKENKNEEKNQQNTKGKISLKGIKDAVVKYFKGKEERE